MVRIIKKVSTTIWNIVTWPYNKIKEEIQFRK